MLVEPYQRAGGEVFSFLPGAVRTPSRLFPPCGPFQQIVLIVRLLRLPLGAKGMPRYTADPTECCQRVGAFAPLPSVYPPGPAGPGESRNLRVEASREEPLEWLVRVVGPAPASREAGYAVATGSNFIALPSPYRRAVGVAAVIRRHQAVAAASWGPFHATHKA